MELKEFIEKYVKENNLKLLPHQKEMIKAMEQGKMYYTGGRSNNKTPLAEAVDAYYQWRRTRDE